ncbi:MAG: sulfite exporter TauE/SafE family protein [Actinobacteria bacterium]|nr:sulfite exporter TauE/SafE family protein [Actinomycetota bacterium]
MMHADALHVVLTLVAGVFTGILSASFGVGGATISTPAIRALGVTALFAVGTTLPSILPSAASGTARYSRERLIDWRVVRLTAPAGVAASVAGSLLSHVVPGHGHWLMIATAGLLGFTAWRMSQGADPPTVEPETDAALAPDVPAGRRHDTPPVLVGVGAAAGLLSGLLGVGGGVVMVPGFTELAHIPLKPAIATSLACVGVFALPGTITHAGLGDIDWLTAALLSVGVVPGARMGAAAAIRARDRRLRLAVASFLGLVSVFYAAGEIIALAR